MSRRRCALALVILIAGCGPRVSHLVRDKHYREAICAAHDGRGQRRALVSNALRDDTALHLHVHRVTKDELQPVLGEATDEVLQRVDLVRVRAQTNALPLDRLDVDIALESGQTQLAAAPVSWETLAYATQERLPEKRRDRTYLTLGNMLRVGAAVVSGGLSLPFTRFRTRTIEYDAPLSEYERMAPRATALHVALTQSACANAGVGTATARGCAGFYVLDESDEVRWSLKVTERWVVKLGELETGSCSYVRVSNVRIGRADQFDAVFGARMRRIDELQTKLVDEQWDRRDP